MRNQSFRYCLTTRDREHILRVYFSLLYFFFGRKELSVCNVLAFELLKINLYLTCEIRWQ